MITLISSKKVGGYKIMKNTVEPSIKSSINLVEFMVKNLL